MHERTQVLLLTGVQLVPMVDMVLMMPLAPVLMRDLGITPGQHGALIAGASLAACAAGLAGAMWLDRFPRRTALLALLILFAGAEAVCALAPTWQVLLAGRVAAGASAGVLGAIVLAVVGDIVPPERRGAATGTVMSAFAIASIVGVPLGAWVAVAGHWQWPFASLGILALLAVLPVARVLPRLDGHVLRTPASGGPFAALRDPGLVRCLGLSAAATGSGFLVIPMISPFLVGNVGLDLAQVPLIYLTGGLAAVVMTPLLGRWSDRHGPARVFAAVSVATILIMVVMTHLVPMPVPVVLAVTTIFIAASSGRFAALAALLGAVADPARRASSFALNGAVQSLAMAMAALVGGMAVVRDGDGVVHGYGTLGWVAGGIIAGSLMLLRGLPAPRSPASPPRGP